MKNISWGEGHFTEFNIAPFLVHTAEDTDECAKFPGQLCAHNCINTPSSYRCTCQAGFTLQADGRTCSQDGQFYKLGLSGVYTHYTVIMMAAIVGQPSSFWLSPLLPVILCLKKFHVWNSWSSFAACITNALSSPVSSFSSWMYVLFRDPDTFHVWIPRTALLLWSLITNALNLCSWSFTESVHRQN